MKRCWVHIGMHKTGSSSVQRSLSKVKNPTGWKYLTVGGSRNMGAALYAMFATEPHRYHWFLKRGDTAEHVTGEGARLRVKLAEAIRACSEENIIISGESLSLIDNDGIRRLKDFLAPLFDEIRVIGYVRAPIGFKISFFQQRVKHSDCPFDFSDFYLTYRRRFKKFDLAFGRENVILRKFEPAAFTNQCVVADFCEQTGVRLPDNSVVERLNESLTREACGILYVYRRFSSGYGVGRDVIKENNQIIAPLIRMRGTRFKVSKAMMGLSPQEKKDLRWMERRLGTNLRDTTIDDGTEVRTEDDLLRVEQATCEEFAATFMAFHEVEIPREKIPAGSPVDPHHVVEFVDYCRSLCRDLNQQNATAKKKGRSRRFWVFRKCWKFLKKAAAGDRSS